uniref:STAS domain-containing protein n=1 Tax=Anas platyrhynchos TaxID=8839 RepID=A0A8B9QWA3_ANAPL
QGQQHRSMRTRPPTGNSANADTGNGERFFGTGFDCLKPAKTRAEKSPPDVCPPSVDTHTLIIDCGAMQFIDTVGFSMLKDTHHDNKEIGVQVLLANCSPSIRHSVLMQRRLLSSGIRSASLTEQCVRWKSQQRLCTGLWREAWGGGAGLMQEKREVQKLGSLKDKDGAC